MVALHRRRVVSFGALESRHELDGERLVISTDLDGRSWWIPACAVWSDADASDRPEHPRGVGQASGRHRAQVVLAALSDRLGWEANRARERGCQLAQLPDLDPHACAVIYDGCLGHGVPTVVVVHNRFVRWGAGVTYESAYRRAMLDEQASRDAERELADIALLLHGADVGVTVVDLASPKLRDAGVERVSVQLLTPSHESVRRWDADRVQ